MTLSKKVVGIILVLLVATAAYWVFMPAASYAQVEVWVPSEEEVCDLAGGTWNGTTCTDSEGEEISEEAICKAFEPMPELFGEYGCEDEDNDPTPPQCGEGEVLEGNTCVPDEEDNGGGGGETTPPADNSGGSSSGGSSSGGGGGSSHSKKSNGGEVLGASTEVCSTPLLTTYLRMGKANDLVEMIKLQLFLSTELGLENLVTGNFDQSTKMAVEQFQLKYADEVLAPWLPFGHVSTSTPTGYVYKTTQRMINKIHCVSLDIPMPQLP